MNVAENVKKICREDHSKNQNSIYNLILNEMN